MSKKILFINRHAPYGQSLARESLDALLASAAYDQDISVLFCDDGVFQLIKDQNAEAIEQKTLASTLPALELYDITQVFAQESALQQRGINTSDLVIPTTLLSNDQINDLKQQQHSILSF